MQDLDQLRDLLLGPEWRELKALRWRQIDPEARASDLAEVLPAALKQAGGAPGTDSDRAEHLAKALEVPVELCIRRSIEHNPNDFADALFPVMGPAIRRAIGEALKGLVQSINQAVEHSLSPRGLAWRWEAWRSGQPFAAVLLKHTLVYRVEAVYLIQHDSGLLIGHTVAASHTTLKDEDAVSAMLTAIQGFMQDAFTGAEASSAEHRLESVEIGGRTLWILPGPHAALACLIAGVPPMALRERMEAVLAGIHATYRRDLATFQGDKSNLLGLPAMLEQCLDLEYRDPAATAQTPARWPWALAGLVALAGLGQLGWMSWQDGEQQRLVAQVEQRLGSTPGILVLGRRDEGEGVRLDLLRDPLAPDPKALSREPGLTLPLHLSVTPFQSLDPGLVLERARRQLKAPPSVKLALRDGTLSLTGKAQTAWAERVRAALILPAGVETLDTAGLTVDLGDLPTQVRAALDPPPGVNLAVTGSEVHLSGSAPWAWLTDTQHRLSRVPLVSACDNTAVEVAEWREAKDLAAELNGLQIFFTEGVVPRPEATEALDRAARILDRLATLDAAVPLGARVTVTGHSDGVGASGRNLWLRQQRAELVRRHLASNPIASALVAESDRSINPSQIPDPSMRRVDFTLNLTKPSIPPCLP